MLVGALLAPFAPLVAKAKQLLPVPREEAAWKVLSNWFKPKPDPSPHQIADDIVAAVKALKQQQDTYPGHVVLGGQFVCLRAGDPCGPRVKIGELGVDSPITLGEDEPRA